jgi:hypothetical protein
MLRWTDKDIALVKEFLDSAKSVDFIASHFKTSPANIRMLMSRNKLYVKNSDSGAPSTLERMQEMDLATRIRMLRGEELLQTEKKFCFEDEQIKRWLEPKGYVIFAKEVLGIELQSYQIEAIEKMLSSKRFVWVAGRATGKSFTTSIAVLYIAITRSNQRILLISPAQRQSDLLYNQVLEFISKNNELFNSVDGSNREKCKFTNNSEIFPLPATTYIRGFQRVSFVFLDESAFFDNPDEALGAIMPMLSIKNESGDYGSLIAVGSPAGKSGLLWDFFNDALFNKMQTPSTENNYVSKDFIEAQKTILPPALFDCEIMAQFSENIDNFFSYELLKKISAEYDYSDFPEPNKDYYFGIDIGRIRDSSVITIISKDKEGMFKVEKILEMNGVEFEKQRDNIRRLHAIFHPKRICIEKAGLSLQMVEELKKDLSILEFEPTLDNKAEAYGFLLKNMQEGKITISSKDRTLQYQLRTFKYEITTTGKMKLHHESESSRDDYPDSLMMAFWATKSTGFLLLPLDVGRNVNPLGRFNPYGRFGY